MLSFRHEVFIEVARHLSFSKASETLYISQPAVSKHIKSLEAFYNVSLFERKGNSIALTDQGVILKEYLGKANALKSQLEYEISTFKDQHEARGLLKLGTSTTVALYIIPSILSSFLQKYPHTNLNLVNRNSENILKALLDHTIDLGIVEGSKKNNSVSYTHFLADEVVAVCSPASPLSKLDHIGLEDLTKIPISIREMGSGTLSAISQALQIHEIKIADLKIITRLGGTEALKNFLLADTCLGFLPLRSVKKELQNGDLVELNIPELTISRNFYFIQRHGTENYGLNKLFVKFATMQAEAQNLKT